MRPIRMLSHLGHLIFKNAASILLLLIWCPTCALIRSEILCCCRICCFRLCDRQLKSNWHLTGCNLNKVLHLPLIISAHQEAAKWISLDWSSLSKRVIKWYNFNKTLSSVKTSWVKAINNLSKKKLAKEVQLWQNYNL